MFKDDQDKLKEGYEKWKKESGDLSMSKVRDSIFASLLMRGWPLMFGLLLVMIPLAGLTHNPLWYYSFLAPLAIPICVVLYAVLARARLPKTVEQLGDSLKDIGDPEQLINDIADKCGKDLEEVKSEELANSDLLTNYFRAVDNQSLSLNAFSASNAAAASSVNTAALSDALGEGVAPPGAAAVISVEENNSNDNAQPVSAPPDTVVVNIAPTPAAEASSGFSM